MIAGVLHIRDGKRWTQTTSPANAQESRTHKTQKEA